MTERLMLLDTASLYFRAFYGVPDTVRAPDGTPVNAVRGLLDMIAKLVTDFGPTQLVACWDDDWRPRWRVDLIPSYKEHRVARTVPGGIDVEEAPELLVGQLSLIRETLDAFGIAVLGAPQHEADDVIGSLASQATAPVDIVTGDRDLFQLVDDATEVRVIYTARGMSRLEIVTDEVVRAKYGIDPRQYSDFAVMRGDTSDGLPGVAGVGDKTAASLLKQYGDLDGILAVAADSDSPLAASIRTKIRTARDYLSVAPRVVDVVRNLKFEDVDPRIYPLDGPQHASVEKLATQWGLGGSSTRLLRAFDNR